MKDFSTLTNTSGSFPSVLAINSTGPRLRDGTPMTANVVNDIWGAFQAILSAAGVTPSGTVETATASDLLDSIRKVGGAVGELVFHAAPSDALDARVLPLKGQVVLISSYADLVAATYVGDANNANLNYTAFIKTSDAAGAVRDTAGTYFKLPDCRGKFIRALPGAATGVDLGRDTLTASTGTNHGNIAGYTIGESPGHHTHLVETVDPSAQGLEKELQYAFISFPGEVSGSFSNVTPEARFMYYTDASADYDVGTKIAKKGATDYSTTYYSEVRPLHISFQVGIRY